MITAVDTSVLFDVFTADQRFGRASHEALTRCLHEGSLIACDAVWAEVAAGFRDPRKLEQALEGLGIGFIALDPDAAAMAGMAWRSYRDAGGTRRRILAHFLIGAHATLHADRLLTRDRGFYRAHFRDLAVFDPAASTT